MLIVSDSSQLGDKALNAEEAVAKAKEENLTMAAKNKLPNQQELEDHERSAGPRIPWQEVIRRLEHCNPALKFKDGSPGNIAVYFPKSPEERIEDGRDPNKTDFFNDHKYVTGFPKEGLPEYSHITVDEHGLPKREIRGWRTILMALVKARAITYTAAVKQFGEAVGQRSTRWHQELRRYK